MRVKTTHFLAVILSLTAAAAPLFAQSKKVRFSVSAASIAEVPFRIANVKGFYREEGLEVEMILIRGAVGMQALLGGSVDYTSASGSTIAAAVRGLPVKLVFIASAKPQFDLIAQPQIRSVADLKGKHVGISSRGGAVEGADAGDVIRRAVADDRTHVPGPQRRLAIEDAGKRVEPGGRGHETAQHPGVRSRHRRLVVARRLGHGLAGRGEQAGVVHDAAQERGCTGGSHLLTVAAAD